MSYQISQTLFNANLDIIGDIHGEIKALRSLLTKLGYDQQGNHPEHRKLIFVGDLCDRGPQSVAVIQLVKTLIEHGNAQCVLGNHELNLLINSKREGNGWFFGSPHEDDEKPFQSLSASDTDRVWIIEFLNSLPLVLESDQLRIVHACWDQQSIDTLKQSQMRSLKEIYDYFVQQTERYLQNSDVAQRAQHEKQQYSSQLKNPSATLPLLKNLGQQNLLEQMMNPFKVLTSGAEVLAKEPFFAGGKWRMVDRLAWWDHYQDNIPVVIGHYWRNFNSPDQKHGLFKYIEPLEWFGLNQNVFCVDYSVGKRYLDRHKQRAFSNQLCALRFPENTLLFEDGSTKQITNQCTAIRSRI